MIKQQYKIKRIFCF